jgi:hypothetical protein
MCRASISSPRNSASRRTTPEGFGYQAGVFLFNENLDIESFDFSNPTDLSPAGDRKSAPGRQPPGHFRIGELQVRSRHDPEGRRPLEPRQEDA